MGRTPLLLLFSFLLIGLTACGGSSSDSSTKSTEESNQETQVGPIQSVDVGPIEQELVKEGKELFETRCKTCHKLDEDHIGPTLRNVANRRDPAYIMNMILAPEDMIQNHPTAKKLFSEYGTMMTNQNLSEDQARALLDFFRQAANEGGSGGS